MPTHTHRTPHIPHSDNDATFEQQVQLLGQIQRSVAQSVGRGMFLFGSVRPVLTMPLPIPPLCLSGKLASTGAAVALAPEKCVYEINRECCLFPVAGGM